jgi:hypothetical protein
MGVSDFVDDEKTGEDERSEPVAQVSGLLRFFE